jgi:hypothetical protein
MRTLYRGMVGASCRSKIYLCRVFEGIHRGKAHFRKKYIVVIEDEHSRLELWIPHMDAKESLSLSMHKSFHITVGSGVLQDPSYSYIVRLLDLEEYT